MHSLGNDFVVLEASRLDVPGASGDSFEELALTPSFVRALADRHRAVGFDQLIIVRPAEQAGVDAALVFYNQDGSRAQACGNGTRCVGHYFWKRDSRKEQWHFVCGPEPLFVRRLQPPNVYRLAFPPPRFMGADRQWTASANLHEASWRGLLPALPEGVSEQAPPLVLSMGNPHAVFFPAQFDLLEDPERFVRAVQTSPLFPDSCNVSFATATSQVISQVISRVISRGLRVRVYERGVGRVLACGSAACAALSAAHLRGLTPASMPIELDGGTLQVHLDDGVHLTGPVHEVYRGVLTPESL